MIFIGDMGHKALLAGEAFKVLAIFSRCFYLINNSNQIICIGSNLISTGPFNMVIGDTKVYEQIYEHIQIDQQVFVTNGKLLFESREYIKLDSLTPCFTPLSIHPELGKIEKGLEGLQETIESIGYLNKENGLAPLIPLFLPLASPKPKKFENLFLEDSYHAITQLQKWLEDNGTHTPHLLKLIGLGPGLTPSGDDFIGGMLIAMNLLNMQDKLSEISSDVLTLSKERTNFISHNLLTGALAGKGIKPIHDIFNRIINGDQDFTKQLSRLSEIGYSSGFDTLLGGLIVFLTFTQMEKNS